MSASGSPPSPCPQLLSNASLLVSSPSSPSYSDDDRNNPLHRRFERLCRNNNNNNNNRITSKTGIEEKKEEEKGTAAAAMGAMPVSVSVLAGDRRRRRLENNNNAVQHTSACTAVTGAGPNSSFEDEGARTIPRTCTTPPRTPPRSPPRYTVARRREGIKNNNSNNTKHVSISPQYCLHNGGGGGGGGSSGGSPGESSSKSIEDADTKTTTTVTLSTTATSAITTSPSTISNTMGHHHHHQQQQQQQPHQQRYTALSDMVQCAYLSPPEDTRDGSSAANSSTCDVALPIPLTLPQNELFHHNHHDGDEEEGEYKYYRIAYRGVVALLSAPERTAPRSGSYLSYGEVFCTRSSRKKKAASENKRTLEQLLEPKFSPRRQSKSTGIKTNNGNLHGLVDVAQGAIESSTSLAGDISASSSDEEAGNLRPCRIEHHLAATGPQIPSLPSRSDSTSSSNSDNHHQRGVVRVDHVITGGYAMDTTHEDAAAATGGMPQCTPSSAKTPKRSNSNPLGYYQPVPDYDDNNMHSKAVSNNIQQQHGAVGFLFSQRNNIQIVEPLKTRPQTEIGVFMYKVVSSTPLPILTGPAIDAPKTKAMLLPGTVHDVSVRVCIDPNTEDTIWFLRLSHRRGWIADRKECKRKLDNTSKEASLTTISVVQEVSLANDTSTVDEASVVSSIAVSSVSAPSTVARRRHRPPRRRRREGGRVLEDDNKPLPRQIGGQQQLQQQQQQHQRSLTSTPVKMNRHNDSSMEGKVLSPSSNMSLLSYDEESFEDQNNSKVSRQQLPSSPDCSHATSAARSAASSQLPSLMLPKAATAKKSSYYLMRVTAPRGLKVLDAPQFQVNRLIHGDVSSSHLVSQIESHKQHQSIFQTMSGRLTTTAGTTSRSVIMDADSKTRILPRGVLFEASGRMERTDGYNHGLLKLSDGSGWAIVPTREDLDQQYRSLAGGGMADVKEGEAMRAFEEVGNAVIGDDVDTSMNSSRGVAAAVTTDDSIWLRVVARNGALVSCPPPSPPLASENSNDHSPSSKGSSAVSGSTKNGSTFGPLTSHDSDVASSVGSAFLDAMFRTPKKTRHQKDTAGPPPPPARPPPEILHQQNNVIPCGMVVQVERPAADSNDDEPQQHEFARLCGGQGWVPLSLSGKAVSIQVQPPETRVGSFWFRVQSSRGIKVRLGPSRRAPSIKSDDGVHFRFECGEFLRASEIMTVFNENGEPEECYAKLYRNRHVRLREANEDYRSLCSLTNQAEFVQVYSSRELFLEECAMEPRIERHKQGWRYNTVLDSGVPVRRGPSFAAEKVDVHLNAGETVVVNERVAPAGEKITWLRLKDGKGWVHDVSDHGEPLMVTHSFRQQQRNSVMDRPQKGPAPKEEIAYNTIIARLFHNNDDTFHHHHNHHSSQNHRSGPKR